jgi:uncharacterized surface protein with fasciclin (FAS1) repeats
VSDAWATTHDEILRNSFLCSAHFCQCQASRFPTTCSVRDVISEVAPSLLVLRGADPVRRQPNGNAVSTSLNCSGNWTLLAQLNSSAQFSSFYKIASQANFTDVNNILNGSAPFNSTLFAPTNLAIANLRPEFVEALNQSRELLHVVLAFHIVPNNTLNSSSIPLGESTWTTFLNTSLSVFNAGGIPPMIILDGSPHVVPPHDVFACNGVIHAIDEVLNPFAPTTVTTSTIGSTTSTLSNVPLTSTLPTTSTLSTITGSVVTRAKNLGSK